ncbi:MAG: CHAT domain-containing protein [Pleurocapsa sp.]
MKYKNYLVLAILVFLSVGFVARVTAQPIVASQASTQSAWLSSQKRSRTQRANLSQDLLLQGKQLYDRGELVAAAKIWEQAKQVYTANGQIVNLIHSNNYLAAVYQDLGNWQEAETAIADNLALVTTSEPTISRRNTAHVNSPLLYAQTLNTKGGWQLKRGEGEAALTTWQEAEAIYRNLEDTTGIILSQINQAQALQTLGFYRRSQKILTQVQQQLDTIPNSPLKIAALRSLGTTLEVTGDLEEAEKVLAKSLSLARTAHSSADVGANLFKLGNLARKQENYHLALDYYQQAISITGDPQTQLKVQLNQLSLLVETKNFKKAKDLIAPIQQQIDKLPASRMAVYARVNYARSLIKMGNPTVEKLLADTVQQAKDLSDNLAQAYAMGELAHWYEGNSSNDRALNLTHEALTLAETANNTQIVANLHWQQGRLLKTLNRRTQAIAAYREAVIDLNNLNQDLIAVNSDLQFSFRQQVEPVYRQLVELLLQDVDKLPQKQKQQHLKNAIDAIEALKQKELENFFRIACLEIKEQNIDRIDSQAAVIYPILLNDSVEVILSIPGQPLKHYRTAIDSAQQQVIFKELLQYLNPVFSSSDLLPTAQKLYNWLIRPAETILQAQNIKTLAFVLDGKLRNLPMSVLHDGQQYLIEKYDLAVTPGLNLFVSDGSSSKNLKIITGGLTEARQGFTALPGVKEEIDRISKITSSQILLDREFTNAKLQERVEKEPFSVIHFATHGQFSSDADDTFILTWNDRIKVKDFDRLLNPKDNNGAIELLVLSACQTARGDERAILGLAGMAVRSGAKSTVATLWSVSDRSTSQLMTEFYHYLQQPKINKANALRQAQLSLLQDKRYRHPYYWSPFILVGDWRGDI